MVALGLDTRFATGESPMATIERLEDRLTSGEFLRFKDLLDGIEVARHAKRWDLVQECGTRALASAGIRSAGQSDVRSAARAVVAGALASATELRDLPRVTADAIRELRTSIGGLEGRPRGWVREQISELHELRLLISSADDPKALTSLCSRLRLLDRPDLGVEAATKALEKAPGNPYALTTRGAACIDIRQFDAARADLVRAWQTLPSEHAACALSPLTRIELKYLECLDWAQKAVGCRVWWTSVRTLAAAAAAAGDEAASMQEAKLFTELGQEVPSRPIDFVAVEGARLMADQGDTEGAVRLLLAVMKRTPGYEPAHRLLEAIAPSLS